MVLCLLGAAALASPGTVIERTLAFVNRKPVLLSDVSLTRALLQLDEPTATERTIDESLMFEEASRLLDPVSGEETLEDAVRVLREKAGDAFTEAALRRKARTQVAIARYIDARLRPLVRVDAADVRQVFNQAVARNQNSLVFSEVADSIRENLEARSLDERIEEWVAALRLRAVIRRPPPPRSR